NRRHNTIVSSSKFRVPSFALQPLLATFFALATRPRRAAAGALALEIAGAHRAEGRSRFSRGWRLKYRIHFRDTRLLQDGVRRGLTMPCVQARWDSGYVRPQPWVFHSAAVTSRPGILQIGRASCRERGDVTR